MIYYDLIFKNEQIFFAFTLDPKYSRPTLSAQELHMTMIDIICVVKSGTESPLGSHVKYA
jgi:hypothetical protein